jgi:hypothetical protein
MNQARRHYQEVSAMQLDSPLACEFVGRRAIEQKEHLKPLV